ncbi:MAG: M23 family metallopeptidase [Bacteroidales bacterium]|nr:M23 family metallopeptidase [Bacteroidales bacterium]
MKHARIIIIVTIVLQAWMLSAQNPIFVQPIEGVYGEDFIIVNYVDWSFDSIMDHQCGSKTYDGHQGTDFLISGFPQMDAGVNVQAVDSGVVVFLHDGEPDRNTDGDPELGFGNYVAIKHPDKHFSYYAHLKKNSIIVAVGEAVVPGQNIAEVGSSGNSTDPHVHFELWYDSLFLVDPFAGPCGNAYNYWIDSLPYDTTFNIWEYGLTDYVTPIDSLRERPKPRIRFSTHDSIITFWTLQYGLKAGDSSRIEWLSPDGNLWYDYSITYQKDWWFYYYYSYIFTPPQSLYGEWTYNYYYNDSLVITDHFMFVEPTGTMETELIPKPVYRYIGKRKLAFDLSGKTTADFAEVYDVSGKRLLHQSIKNQQHFVLEMPGDRTGTGFYLLIIKHSGGVWRYKLLL